MAHIVVIAEGYRDDLETMKHRLENKVYKWKNPVDNKMSAVQPAVREIQIWDIVIQKELIEDVMRDLGVPQTQKRFWGVPFKLWNLVLRLLKPFKLQPIPKVKKLYVPYKGVYPGLTPRVKVLPLGIKKDKIHKDGYEEV